MSKEIKIGYRILKIHTKSFSVKDIPEEQFNSLFNNGNSILNIGSNINFDKDKSTITIDIQTSLTKKGENKQIVSHSGRTVFLVNELEQLFNSKENSYDLPNNFLLQLLGISFSHSRALLSTELQSTAYADKFILPVVNPSILLPKNLQQPKREN